jgi:hypothetical protein
LDADIVALKLFWFQYTRADSPLVHLTKGQLKSLGPVESVEGPMSRAPFCGEKNMQVFRKWGLTLVPDREWGRVVS